MKQELIVNTTTPSKFIAKLFEARDTIHLCHLSTDSFAKHIALDEFYKGIIKLTDSLVESYQGKYGELVLTIGTTSKQDCISYLQSFISSIELTRRVFSDSFIQNQIDSILQLSFSTLYKLINLK